MMMKFELLLVKSRSTTTQHSPPAKEKSQERVPATLLNPRLTTRVDIY